MMSYRKSWVGGQILVGGARFLGDFGAVGFGCDFEAVPGTVDAIWADVLDFGTDGQTDGQTDRRAPQEISPKSAGTRRRSLQNRRFWRRLGAPPKSPDTRGGRVQNGDPRFQNGDPRSVHKPTSDCGEISGLLFLPTLIVITGTIA